MALVDTISSLYTTFYFFMFWFWWLIILGALMLFKLINKNWKVEAIIIEKRGKNLLKTNDRAARYTDPYTGVTGYKFQKSKDTIPIVNYDWVLHNVVVPNSFLERMINILRGTVGTIFVFRYGSKQYKPVKIKVGEKTKLTYKEIKDSKGNPIYIKIYKSFDPRNIFGDLDFEVIDWDNMNFMVQEQRASIERRKKKGDFWKQIAIPIIMIAVTALVCIMMLKFSFDYASEVRGSAPTNTPATAPKVPIIGDIVPGT